MKLSVPSNSAMYVKYYDAEKTHFFSFYLFGGGEKKNVTRPYGNIYSYTSVYTSFGYLHSETLVFYILHFSPSLKLECIQSAVYIIEVPIYRRINYYRDNRAHNNI